MTATSPPAAAGALWLPLLQQAMSRASHDVKDAINGVSVNLEVVRSRAARPDAPASAVASFAESAAQQLERMTSLIEAVLALGRAAREPVDAAGLLRQLAALCGASASAADATVQVDDASPRSGLLTSVPGDVARAAIAAPLLAMVTGGDNAGGVRCTAFESASGVRVSLLGHVAADAMPGDVRAALLAAGGMVEQDDDGLTLILPRA